MARNYTIYRRLNYDRLQSLVPRRYQNGKLPKLDSGEQAALIVFQHDQVIVSSRVRRALSEVPDVDESVKIAAGYCFTVEGLAMLAERGFRVMVYIGSYWTDERYQEIFQIRISELGA